MSRRPRLEVAIVADDLTGALDSAAPFAARGLRTVAALDPGTIGEALEVGAAVVAVNTLTRHLPPGEAAAVAGEAARRCVAAGAGVLLKKIDSRLRGQVGAEAAAVARAAGAGTLVVAPAVPSQGRIVAGGAVRGAGVDEPGGIDIRALFLAAAGGLAVEIPDGRDEADLDVAAASCAARGGAAVGVGAHGLASALARLLAGGAAARAVFAAEFPALLVVGSQDPATAAQVAALLARRHPAGAVTLVEAPGGRVLVPPPTPPSPVTVLRSMSDTGQTAGPAAERFAAGASAWVTALRPRTLLATGGDTAAALLAGLGVRLLEVDGEAAPGIPWCRTAGGTTVLTKSGGFGGETALVDLLRPSGDGGRH